MQDGSQRINCLYCRNRCSQRQARDVVAAAHKDWLDACYGSEEIDQRDFKLFQQVRRLERIARKAEDAGQFSAGVGAITAFNRMMALGADQKGFRGHSNHHYRREERTSTTGPYQRINACFCLANWSCLMPEPPIG